MKVTTEKLPKSLIALDIELDHDQVEKGLDRAARRLSEKHNIPGFRKGKAPRFIIERYFGRDALMEEASHDLVSRSLKKALEQEHIFPIGRPQLNSLDIEETFRFRVTVPVTPTVVLPDYRSIRLPLNIRPIDERSVHIGMEIERDKHVMLRELDDPRPAQAGDMLTIREECLVDGVPLEKSSHDKPSRELTIVLEAERLVPGLYEKLIGMHIGEHREVTLFIDHDHEDEQIRGKETTFKIDLVGIQERVVPDWDEVFRLEQFEGTLDEFRQKIRKELEAAERAEAEQNVVNMFMSQVEQQAEYDIADATIESLAEDLLRSQERQFSTLGVTLEQMLQHRGKTFEEAVEEMKPIAEQQIKSLLVMRQIAKEEDLSIPEEAIQAEMQQIISSYPKDQQKQIAKALAGYRDEIERKLLDQKVFDRIIAIVTDETPSPSSLEDGVEDGGAGHLREGESHTQEDESVDNPSLIEEIANISEIPSNDANNDQLPVEEIVNTSETLGSNTDSDQSE